MKLLTVAAMAFTLLAGSVNAAEQLNAYSIMPEKYASKVFAEFTKDTGIKVNFMRFSSGEALARLNAEKKNPQVDVMLGGPADTYAAGVKEGIFEQYRPKDSDAIPANLRDPQNHWTGIGIIPLCFLTNTKFLEKNKMHAPESWNDLLDPRYKNNLQMADLLPRESHGRRSCLCLSEKIKRQHPDVHQERCRRCDANRYRPVRLRHLLHR